MSATMSTTSSYPGKIDMKKTQWEIASALLADEVNEQYPIGCAVIVTKGRGSWRGHVTNSSWGNHPMTLVVVHSRTRKNHHINCCYLSVVEEGGDK